MSVYNKVRKITAAANSSGEVDLYTVPPAQKFMLKRVIFIFPAGTGGKLGLAVKDGVKQLCPDEGLAYGDDTKYSLADDTVLGGSEKLKLYYENEDTASDLEAIVAIEGEILYG